jgi:hypothetical protein
MYFTATSLFGNEIIIWKIGDIQYSCACDEMNVDYQKYLAWVAEGYTAEQWQQPEQETE